MKLFNATNSRLWALAVLLFVAAESVAQERSSPGKHRTEISSRFFQDDSHARKIIAGETTEYRIGDFPLVSGQGFVSTDSFAYRVLSAIRQLGYTPVLHSEPEPGKALLHKFQRLNGLPTSDLITKELLQALDVQLKESEAKDNRLGPTFPLYARLTNQIPLHEPSREHFARLLAAVFGALPKHLVPYSLENFHNFYRQQLPYFIDKGRSGDANPPGTICDINYYPEFSNDCLFRANKIITLNNGEFEVAGILFHEYAHWLDGNLFPPLEGTARGSIATLGFYGISFDTAAGSPHSDTRIYYPLRRGQAVIAREFVSAYGRGHEATLDGALKYSPFEDFAESFGLYVQGGRIFRHLARSDSYLQQKYDWLREHVFAGIEYETGSLESIELLRRRPTAQSNIAFNVNDFGRIDPDHVFPYHFPRLEKTTPSTGPAK
jgi:hypothetical protein